MSRRRRGHGGGGHGDEHPDERWLVSYADMITVLLALFIMMYAASSVNISKYHALQKSTAEALGSDPSAVTPPKAEKPDPRVSSPPETPQPEVPDGTLDELVTELRKQVKDAGLAGVIEVSREARGVVIRFSDRVLFPTGSAELTPQGKAVLTRLSPVLKKQVHPLVIEGHTDNRPIVTNQFPSNWELSTYRSTSVLHHLTDRGIPGKRLSAAGYADTHPRTSNVSDAGRAKNRRVEIVVQAPLPAPTATPAAPAKAPAPAAVSTPAPAAPAKSKGH